VVVCLDRGHSAEVVQAALAEPLSGAREPVAVEVARLRDLAATDAKPPPIAAAALPAVVEPHLYGEGTAPGRCGTCGRHEGATAGGARMHPRPESAIECTHGRHPVGCPLCRAGVAPAPQHRLHNGCGRGRRQ
jgi:hypothetical protein